jgi:hypothetical protein
MDDIIPQRTAILRKWRQPIAYFRGSILGFQDWRMSIEESYRLLHLGHNRNEKGLADKKKSGPRNEKERGPRNEKERGPT